jgi:uncharacterized protein
MAPLPSHATVHMAGELLHLLPAHALWWPARQTLFIADLHLGKAASYRAHGQPVPSGTTHENFARLDALIAAHRPLRLVVLGDFLHAASGRTAEVVRTLIEWRAQHAAVAITLVRGNHDGHAGEPPPEARIDAVREPWLLGPFACGHHPQHHPTHVVLAGHLHPVCRLRGPARDGLRLPCFVIEPGQLILPAFGAFTGGHLLRAAPGRSFYAIGGHRVWAVPAGKGPSLHLGDRSS